MASNNETQARRLGGLRRAANAVKRLFSRGRGAVTSALGATSSKVAPAGGSERAAAPARVTRREADIPLEVIDRTYTPPFTGAKASFRSDGSDHQSDQEFAYGVSDDRWNDEDRFTNKSGDPRIGTHRRTYEPGEVRTGSGE